MNIWKIATNQAVTASGYSATMNTAGPNLNLVVKTTAVSGTGSPSLTVAVQYSDDNITWATPTPAQAFPAITATGAVVAQFAPYAPYYRLSYTVSGTNPSFTISVVQTDY